MSADLERVIKRARRGDEKAITTLYELHADAIYRYILYRVPTSADAEDLTAEVFLRMVESLPNYNIRGVPFEAWLYRIAAARIADFYRQNKRQPQAELNETLADDVPLPEDQIQQRQEIQTLREALRKFSEEEQTILLLRFVERKSHREVANILGKTTNAVKAAQHRALVHLAALLGSEDKVRHYLRGDDD
ncbi:MAG TPA: sigma-70 family RNA polymerase sigma factor [Spirillospora sp.]|nr:sigma-70 family RNA polymerase sigma factor [Spirillospora sp.]